MAVKESDVHHAHDTQNVHDTRTDREHWQLRRWSHNVKSSFQKAWATQPQQAWRPWLITLVIGWIICAGLMVGMAIGIRALEGTSVLAWERPWMQSFIEASPLSITKVLYLGLPAHTLSVTFVMALATVIAILQRRPFDAMSISFGVVLMTCIVFLGWQVAARDRPDLVLNGALAPGFHSFPSGHVAHSTILYGLLTYFWVRQTQHWGERMLAIILCVLLLLSISAGRLLEGAHWPTDILASYVIGGAWLAVVITALRRLPQRV